MQTQKKHESHYKQKKEALFSIKHKLIRQNKRKDQRHKTDTLPNKTGHVHTRKYSHTHTSRHTHTSHKQ